MSGRRAARASAFAGAAAFAGMLAGGVFARPATAFPVEPGSYGNLLVIHVTNPDPQLALAPHLYPRDVPGFVARLVPASQLTAPGQIMPAQSGDGLFVFDVSGTANVGEIGTLVIVLRRAADDSMEIAVPLEVVAPELLDYAVNVVFGVDFTGSPPPGGAAVVALVDGNAPVPLADDGTPPDAQAGDLRYAGSLIFGPGSGLRHRWLVTIDGVPECDTTLAGDHRLFVIHPIHDDSSNPQLLPVAAAAACATIGVPLPVELATIVVLVNAPNPFTRATSLRFDLERAGRVELQIFDVAGRRLRSFALGGLAPGRHLLAWDGRDADGVDLKPGAYFMRLLIDGRVAGKRRAVLVR